MVKVVFFAALRERLGCAETELTGFRGSVELLLEALSEKQPHWRQWLQDTNLLCAVNQELAEFSALVDDGDEVALFPPVTGG